MTTTLPTREELEAQAADLNAQLEAIRQEEQRAAEEAEQRRQAARERLDRQYVAEFSRKQLDEDVQQAERELQEALAGNPLVLAMADYLTVLRRRRYRIYDQHAAMLRVDPTTGAMPEPPRAELENVSDLLGRLVERISTERLDDERQQTEARREAAITEEQS